MFKIQNFLNRTRHFLNKIKIPTNQSKYQASFHPSSTRRFILVPSSCMFGMSLLSKERFKFETVETSSPIQSGAEPVTLKAEKVDVIDLIGLIITELKEEKFENARTYIEKGIQISEHNEFNEFLPYLYDSLITITIQEGDNTLAEEILVRSIEKLTEIGYREADNEIVRFKLMLARLYQTKGDTVMARLGFRNCITTQEAKCNADKDMDDASSLLYLSVLFWYSIFLNEENELNDSKNYMNKALELSKSIVKEPAQTLVILYNLAELSFRLKVKNFEILLKTSLKQWNRLGL